MNVFTASQMAKLDAYTIKKESILSVDLMERAAVALTAEVTDICSTDNHIFIFAGSGGNGGDALAMARLLSQKDYTVSAYLINIDGHLNPDCEINRNRLIENAPNVEFHEITSQFDMPAIDENDVIIDGLFGTGLSRPISGGFAMLVKFINRSGATIISIDIPSGLMCEDNTNNYHSNIIRANYTLTIQALKPSFLMADNQVFIGNLKVINIGLEENECPQENRTFYLDEEDNMRALIHPRDAWGHKGTFGHGLLIAGSYGMAGAAILAAKACLRSGIGKLTVHSPRVNTPILQGAVPEAVIHPDEENYYFSSSLKADTYTATAIGPGIGLKKDTALAVIEQISHSRTSIIIDADALNLFADHQGWLIQIPSCAILTPHPGEFSRIFGECNSNYQMLINAREQAIRLKCHIILKGHYTAICCPDGVVYFNTTGNEGMATAGSGDTLTGILLALSSQGYSNTDACRLAVYIHGLAGDIATSKLGSHSVIASDIIDNIPEAIKLLIQK